MRAILTFAATGCLGLGAFAEVRIVIPQNPERAVRIAADEFAKCHARVTGFKPVVGQKAEGEGPFVRISVDATGFGGGTDAYRIRSAGDGLELVGRNGR